MLALQAWGFDEFDVDNYWLMRRRRVWGFEVSMV